MQSKQKPTILILSLENMPGVFDDLNARLFDALRTSSFILTPEVTNKKKALKLLTPPANLPVGILLTDPGILSSTY